MPNEDHTDPTSASSPVSRRGQMFRIVLAMVVALMVVIGFVATRSDVEESPSTSTVRRDNTATTNKATMSESRTEIAARLREILEVRDRAILSRNADLLTDIYTVDCKCLKDGRALIGQLKREGIIWRGVKTSVAIQKTEEVNERLWIVVAAVTTPSVRIENEAGQLIRVVPPERNLVQFALAKPPTDEEWLLGHASNFD